MTSRERWLAVLDGKQPDRIPTDIWYTPEVEQRLKVDLNCQDNETLYQQLHIDRPLHIEAPFGAPLRCKLAHHPDDPEANIWGLQFRNIGHGTGEYAEVSRCPLADARSVADVEAFRWPAPDDFDYTSLDDEFAKVDGTRVVQAGSFEPFLLACQMRGMERAYMDLAMEPEIIEAILGRIFAFFYEHNRRIFEAGAGRIDLLYLAEDLGSQSGPLMSPDTYRRFLKPNQIRMAELARKHRIKIIYHTDGAVRPFLEDLVDEVGIDVLNPIQYRCPGMEREELVRDFGDRIAFHGAIENQQVMPFGSVRDVVDEVKGNIAAFAGARWICAPCHNLQSNTPTANIVALYETIHEFGRM